MRHLLEKYLAYNLPGDIEQNCIETLPHKVTVSLVGRKERHEIWRTKQVINFQTSEITLAEVFVYGDFRRRGISRRLASNSVSLASRLGLRRASLRATGLGRYVWAVLGYQPSFEVWNGLLRPKYIDLLDQYEGATVGSDLDDAREILSTEDPAAFALLAEQSNLVTCLGCTDYLSGMVPVGQAFLIEGLDWSGSKVIDQKV